MKSLNKFTDEYFNKYNEKPVKLIPYSSRMAGLANKYVDLIREILKEKDVEVKIIGSVAYQIPTADVEVAVYIKNYDWKKVLELLEDKFGKPVYSEKEFALFPIAGEEYEFDIHVYSGYEGLVSKKLTEYMQNNPDLINKYQSIKTKYSFSKKQYQYNKYKFLEDIIKKIPF
jgi:GrpB-like predicted nucleotidyltransferase (UPF0157 family)